MPDHVRELMVFPTELALRRHQQELALRQGWVDASAHTTFARIRKCCLPYIRLKGRRMTPARRLMLRSQVVELAQGHFAGEGALGELSASALADVLDQLVAEMATLPAEARRICDWLLERPRGRKLYQLGTLFSIWRACLMQEGLADGLDTNLAILKLLQGDRRDWPPLLRSAKSITFRSVRWFNPFEEACVAALNSRLKLRVESALPPAHAEGAADRLGQLVRAEIMTEPWSIWAEDLGDALAVDSPDLFAIDALERIGFSRSSGAYGEIEDLARRICWHLGRESADPHRIALVVPNIGAVQDIIPHVFSRFGIPYYFRRGRPVLSSPAVKAFMAWLAFPLVPERDALIDLLRNPAIRFDCRESMVEMLLKAQPRVAPEAFAFIHRPDRCSGRQVLDILQERIVEPEDHFNAEALATVSALLKDFGDQSLPLRELVDLLEELLENATVRPRDSHEQGVWILNPYDAVGLEFDLVLFAGLNEGEFPSIAQQDALFSDSERQWLRRHLEEQGIRLPALALARADVLYVQQSVLFLTVLGMARRQLVLSYQSADPEGQEKGAGEFFRKLWMLAGWAAQERIVPGPYDNWRMGRLSGENMFSSHLADQMKLAPEDRIAMPGESFLTVVPLPLCRAADEALQAAASDQASPGAPDGENAAAPGAPLEHLVRAFRIETEREAYLDTPSSARKPSAYCGHLGSMKAQVARWFEEQKELCPTALEILARGRYVFLLKYVFGMEEARLADDTPDPMDRGRLIHSILRAVYAGIAEGGLPGELPRQWAVRGSSGWRIRPEPGADAVPLAVFDPSMEEHYVEYARTIAREQLTRSFLGHEGLWRAECEKIMEQVLNQVRYDVRTCADEQRYPALFELRFGGDSAIELADLRLKGIVDRVDLLFDEAGALSKIRVLDYKGSSRALGSHDEYLAEMVSNLNCQLPVYALAAQARFLGECNTPAAHAVTEAGFRFLERSLSDMSSRSGKSLVAMDAPDLIDGFLATLSKNIALLKDGDFSVDPLIASYNDYESVCRTTAVDRDDLE